MELTNLEQERLAKLRELHFSKFNILCEYENLSSIEELLQLSRRDFDLINKLVSNGSSELKGLLNLLKNFNWFMWYSDHLCEPATLIEDDFNGISYYDMMKDIYNKFFISNSDGKETNI